jgi:hypothetical protein
MPFASHEAPQGELTTRGLQYPLYLCRHHKGLPCLIPSHYILFFIIRAYSKTMIETVLTKSQKYPELLRLCEKNFFRVNGHMYSCERQENKLRR